MSFKPDFKPNSMIVGPTLFDELQKKPIFKEAFEEGQRKAKLLNDPNYWKIRKGISHGSHCVGCGTYSVNEHYLFKPSDERFCRTCFDGYMKPFADECVEELSKPKKEDVHNPSQWKREAVSTSHCSNCLKEPFYYLYINRELEKKRRHVIQPLSRICGECFENYVEGKEKEKMTECEREGLNGNCGEECRALGSEGCASEKEKLEPVGHWNNNLRGKTFLLVHDAEEYQKAWRNKKMILEGMRENRVQLRFDDCLNPLCLEYFLEDFAVVETKPSNLEKIEVYSSKLTGETARLMFPMRYSHKFLADDFIIKGKRGIWVDLVCFDGREQVVSMSDFSRDFLLVKEEKEEKFVDDRLGKKYRLKEKHRGQYHSLKPGDVVTLNRFIKTGEAEEAEFDEPNGDYDSIGKICFFDDFEREKSIIEKIVDVKIDMKKYPPPVYDPSMVELRVAGQRIQGVASLDNLEIAGAPIEQAGDGVEYDIRFDKKGNPIMDTSLGKVVREQMEQLKKGLNKSFGVSWMNLIMGMDKTERREETHSLELRFPNGDLVTVPRPDGDDWKEESILDDWTNRNPDEHLPRIFDASVCYDDGTPESVELETERNSSIGNFEINHLSGIMTLAEYAGRIDETEPDLLSLSKWTRTVIEEKKDEEKALPMLSEKK